MNLIPTPIAGFYLRFAVKEDAAQIVKYIRDLAAYENELEHVSVTTESIEKYLFHQKEAEVILGIYENKPVGFALFHKTFSTFLGKPGIGLVDLYIEPDQRSKGFGKLILAYLARLTVERGCGRLEWWCHDWNDSAIQLYKKWGALPIENIRVYRLCDEALHSFIKDEYAT